MLIFYILIAIFIAWIWVDYFLLIDIYEKDNLGYLILMFLLGASSVLIVFGLEKYFLKHFNFELTNSFINDFIYSVLKIGLVEEISKLIPFLIFYKLFKKQFNEPIDYIIFISVSALGFSAVENIIYFNRNGAGIINGRAILSTVGHMFDTALIGYGIVLYKFKQKPLIILIIFLFLAALSHGFYDFWLLYESTKKGGIFITILYFLITIEIFSTILNNSLNNSSFFNYKIVIDSNRVYKKLLIYYGLVYLLQTIVLSFSEGLEYALKVLHGSIYFTGFIIVITSKRLSRFKLIKNRWNKVSISFPFTFNNSGTGLVIKGDSYNESYISEFYNDYIQIVPLSYRNTYLGDIKNAYIEKKIFLKNDETFYLAKVYQDESNENFKNYLLKPKTKGKVKTNDSELIIGLLDIGVNNLENNKLKFNDFDFLEWCTISNKK
ncbi:PrsW family intramembrane metalloprotease [Aquimarina aggregata]|uniref:PrsW family intramembrane metalloprotease n=1 Tax=Aquimarina aggregata TaxID=1642818 RepID=UPI002493BAB1|nr:PrsW family intramembrane metalloprotease [Aquimarina aggregata]